MNCSLIYRNNQYTFSYRKSKNILCQKWGTNVKPSHSLLNMKKIYLVNKPHKLNLIFCHLMNNSSKMTKWVYKSWNSIAICLLKARLCRCVGLLTCNESLFVVAIPMESLEWKWSSSTNMNIKSSFTVNATNFGTMSKVAAFPSNVEIICLVCWWFLTYLTEVCNNTMGSE